MPSSSRCGQPGSITWSLYELMPIDGYEFFARWDDETKMMVGLDRDTLTKLLPNTFNWPADPYNRFLDQFERLNRPAKDDDPPECKWVQVKFLKPHEIKVDSDAAQSLLDRASAYSTAAAGQSNRGSAAAMTGP